jgi:hypothetical protein
MRAAALQNEVRRILGEYSELQKVYELDSETENAVDMMAKWLGLRR